MDKLTKIFTPGEVLKAEDLNKISDKTNELIDHKVGNKTETGGELFNDIDNNIAAGNFSHAEGTNVRSLGEASHAEGRGELLDLYWTANVTNINDKIFTVDSIVPSTGNPKHTLGKYNLFNVNGISYRVDNLSEDKLTFTCDKPILFGLGSNNLIYLDQGVAYGDYSHVEGDVNIASGRASHAEGNAGHAFGLNSHSEGFFGRAIGNYSHVEGWFGKAYGESSHAEGNNTTANGKASHVEGEQTVTNNLGEHAEGKFNKSHVDKTISSIGVGTGAETENRSNAVEVHNDGKMYVNGIGNYTGKEDDFSLVKSLQDIIKDLDTRLKVLEGK